MQLIYTLITICITPAQKDVIYCIDHPLLYVTFEMIFAHNGKIGLVNNGKTTTKNRKKKL